jgi:hypothetical protein
MLNRISGAMVHLGNPWLKAVDVALIPYRLTEYAVSVYPSELNEDLALAAGPRRAQPWRVARSG